MSRIPRWAEKTFSAQCSLHGAVASQPDEDTNGWDLLVEFPDAYEDTLNEAAPPKRKAFVQIKSTRAKNFSVGVKLSNMLSACRSPEPWFIFLVATDGATYGRHIEGALMAASLKGVRKARLDKKQLHKERLTVNFSAADRVEGDVVRWMQDRMLSGAAEYATFKQGQYQTLGYENGWGSGKFTVTTDREEAIAEAFLGLGDGLNVEQVSFTHERFNIPEPMNAPLGAGRVFFDPFPIDTCDIRLGGTANQAYLPLRGKVYGFSPPHASTDRARLRFSAPPVEIILGPNGGKGLLTLASKSRHDLGYFQRYTKICRWMREGAIRVEVKRRGKSVYRGEMHCNTDGPIFSTLIAVIEGLTKITDEKGPSELAFSLTDFNAALPRIFEVAQLVNSDVLRVEAPEDSFTEASYTSILHPFSADLGRWTLVGLINRPVLKDVRRDGMRQITAGLAELHDVSVMEDANEEEKEVIKTALLELERELERDGMPLTAANMMEWLEETRTQKLDQIRRA